MIDKRIILQYISAFLAYASCRRFRLFRISNLNGGLSGKHNDVYIYYILIIKSGEYTIRDSGQDIRQWRGI